LLASIRNFLCIRIVYKLVNGKKDVSYKRQNKIADAVRHPAVLCLPMWITNFQSTP
jgi:hypothetical protein